MQRAKKLCLKVLRWSALVVLPLLGLLLSYACLSLPYYSSKYEPIAGQTRPTEHPSTVIPGVQHEGHTCGFLALSSIYVAYGLDPVRSRLRFRLGVDQTAVPLASGTEGTLHPDLFRVAVQDGFEIATIDPAHDATEEALLEHLGTNAALALIHTGTGLHWIALDYGGDQGEVRVSDSLKPEPQFVGASELLAKPVLSLLLFQPGSGRPTQTTSELHANGVAEMARVSDRMRAIEN